MLVVRLVVVLLSTARAAQEMCHSWCSTYTCDWLSCSECSVCQQLADGKICAGWCNPYTPPTLYKHCRGCSGGHAPPSPPAECTDNSTTRVLQPVQGILDISGLAYMGQGVFVAVGDSKLREFDTHVQVVLIQIPKSLRLGLEFMDLTYAIKWPPARAYDGDLLAEGPHDLESASRIPETRYVLLCESVDSRDDVPTKHEVMDRIYLGEVPPLVDKRGSIRIHSYTTWSSFTYAHNVEATTVVEVTGVDYRYIFMWGERSSSTIKWTDLSLDVDSGGVPKVEIGKAGLLGSATFNLTPTMKKMKISRPLTGLSFCALTGEIVASGSFDDDSDYGPYRSVTFIIGKVSGATVEIFEEPVKVTIQDGFKVEAVSRVDNMPDAFNGGQPYMNLNGGKGLPMTFIGTDDENYGGTLRNVAETHLTDDVAEELKDDIDEFLGKSGGGGT